MDTNERTAPYYEEECFDSIIDALKWKQIRKRVPQCFKQTLRNRYFFTNFIYLGYTIGLLIIDFDPSLNPVSPPYTNSTTTTSELDQPVIMNDLSNRIYVGLAALNLFVAILYWWAWSSRSWLDIVLIPEYLNQIQASLYLWSSIWYPKQDTLGGYYTIAIHRIELSASCVELCAAIGWIVTWYMTYTRTLGRGFTLDDPDTVAYLTTTTNTIMYFVYNLQMNLHPEQYGTNLLFVYADVLGFIGAFYYLMSSLRDENWFWFLPLAGQYGVAAGRIHVQTKSLPQFGRESVLITDICHRKKSTNSRRNDNRDNHSSKSDAPTAYF